ncbi:MAG: DUF2059 domain-containing protein [Flavobacteriaceae bacterium]
MKKIILVIVLAFSMLAINAQEKDQFTKDTENLVQIISETAFEPLIDQFSGMVAEENKDAFVKEVKATFPTLYAAMAKIYKEEFTHAEVKDILAFYETSTGKKLASKTGVLSQKGMAAGQAWGMEVQAIMAKHQN